MRIGPLVAARVGVPMERISIAGKSVMPITNGALVVQIVILVGVETVATLDNVIRLNSRICVQQINRV